MNDAALATAPPQSAVGSSVQPPAGVLTYVLMPLRLDGRPGRVPPAAKSRTDPSAKPTRPSPPGPSKFDAIVTVGSVPPSRFNWWSTIVEGTPASDTTCRTPPSRSK